MNKTIYSTIAAFGLAVGANAEHVKFGQLPAAAQKTVNRNLNGGMVQEIDRKTENGRTIYDVEIRREGRNNHICVDADGKLVPRRDSVGGSASLDVDVDRSDRSVFDKNDGKILGVVDNPKKDDFEAEARVGDDGVKVETNVEKPRDRGVTEDIFDKNDGKILDVVPVPGKNKVEADVDVDTEKKVDVDIDRDRDLNAEIKIDTDNDSKVRVETNEGKGKGIFRKGDGKILGIPIPGRNRADHPVSADANRGKVTTDADGGLDTDKNDGRILGVPKRGFETLSMNELPPVVRETIRREAGGYKVAEIERASLDGRTVYEIDIQRDGGNRELHIAPDGNILKDSDREAVGSPATQEQGRGTQRK